MQISTRATRGSAAATAAAAASASSASNSTIGNTTTPIADERVLERVELGQQRGFDAGAGLVAGPEVVAERLDDVIGGHGQVRRAVPEQVEHRGEDALHRGDLEAVRVLLRRHRVVVPKELVGAVDQVDQHAGAGIVTHREDPRFRVEDTRIWAKIQF